MKATALIAAATFACLSTTAFAAGNDAYPNGSKTIPDSSTAATPSSVKHSPGTVGAMTKAGEGSFTASKSSMAKENLKSSK